MRYILTTLFIVLASYAAVSFSIYRMARKAQVSDLWMAWIPGFNFALLCRIMGKSGWLTLLLAVPVVNFILVAYVAAGVSRALGKSPWLGLFLLVPGFGLLLFPYLAFCDEPWVRKNGIWAFPALGIAAFGAFAGAALSLMGMMKSSDAYRLALSQARSAPSLAEKLGGPVTPGWYVLGKIALKNKGEGTALLSFPVSGPRGKATLLANAVEERGEWHLKLLAAKMSTGERLLLTASAAPFATIAASTSSTSALAPAPAPLPPAAAVSSAPEVPAAQAPAQEASDPEPAQARPDDIDEIAAACSNEIGIICYDVKSKPKAVLRCLKNHEDDLLEPCRRKLERP